MNFISNSLERMRPSATILISQKARAMRQMGENIISLSAGEPDFDTPQNIKKAAILAIEQGKTKYTNIGGIVELRAAIAKKFKRDNNLDIPLENCFVSTGGKQIIFNVFVASLNETDEVIIPKPYWVSYPEIVRFCGAKPIFVETDINDRFKLTPEKLEAAISPKTKWLIINSPSNPSGAVYTKKELKALAEILKKHPNIWVFSDDIYEKLVYGDVKFATMAEVAPEIADRIVTMNGLSKSHAMTGWRLGYCAAPAKLIKQMEKLQAQSTSAACSITQWAAVEALNGKQDFLAKWVREFADRRNFMVAKLNNIKGISCLQPDGAFYLFPSIEGLIGKVTMEGRVIRNDEDFVFSLLEEAKVAAVQGSAFGLKNHIRISYAAAKKDLQKASERIEIFCKNLR